MNLDQMNVWPTEWEGLQLTGKEWDKAQEKFYHKILDQHKKSKYPEDPFYYPINLILKEI